RSVARAYAGRPDPTPDVDPVAARDLEAQFGAKVAGRTSDTGRRDATPGPASPIAPEGADGRPGYGFVHVTLPAELVRRLDLRRLPVGATINDILPASPPRAVADWTAGRGRPAESIAVLMPVNLRPPEWRHEVVGNLTLGGTVVSTTGQRTTDESLL